MLRRETIIALRARHTAYRVATDLVFPPQPPPEPVLEEVKPPPPLPTPEEAAAAIAAAEARRAWVERVMRRSEHEWQRKERRRARGERLFAMIIAVAFLLFIAFAISVAIIEGTEPPPPTVTN
jgi:hypothetical protein